LIKNEFTFLRHKIYLILSAHLEYVKLDQSSSTSQHSYSNQ
jgi:hypothetical protein